jgi:hypothetical protein
MCELLEGNRSSICKHLWCVAHQVLVYRAAESADAQELGSVMEVYTKMSFEGSSWVYCLMMQQRNEEWIISALVTLRTVYCI